MNQHVVHVTQHHGPNTYCGKYWLGFDNVNEYTISTVDFDDTTYLPKVIRCPKCLQGRIMQQLSEMEL